eukprot:gene28866-37877_t
MSRNPFDGRDLNFDELKAAAVLCISVAYPTISIPLLSETVLSNRIALGIKLQAIAYIRKAAVTIADNLTSADVNDSENNVQSNLRIVDGIPQCSANTRIKRPTVLKILNNKKLQEEKARGNQKLKFSSIADLFFFPMLQYLASKLRPDTTRRQKGDDVDRNLLNGAEEFNLISELFDSPEQEQVRTPFAAMTSVEDMSKRKKKKNSTLLQRGIEPLLEPNSTQQPVLRSSSPSSSPSRPMYVLEETDSVDVLLPTETLLALADFCRCCRASNESSASSLLKPMTNSLAIHAALECYLSSFAGTPRQNHEVFQPRGIMDSLLHVLSPERDKNMVHFEEAEELRSMHVFQEECMVVAVDWAASSLRQEGDLVIQAIMQAIIKLAVE